MLEHRRRPIYDLNGVMWSVLTATAVLPVARCLHSMAEAEGQGGAAAFTNITSEAASENYYSSKSLNCMSWDGPQTEMPEQKVALKAWRSLQPSALNNSLKPKLAFLMMMYETIVFPKSWEALLTEPGADFTMLIHAKNDARVPAFFQKFVMKEKVDNARCFNTNLMMRMMELAFENANDVSHVSIVSGDTLPVKPLLHMYSDLRKDSRTRFCADLEWERAETYFVMHRDHVKFYKKHHTQLEDLISLTTGRWPCEDEDMFFWPLHDLKADLLDSCVMMTDWSDTPKYWAVNAKRCQCPGFLASTKQSGSCYRPSMFKDVTARGLEELFSSPAGYWFVRKFPGDGINNEKPVTVNGEVPLDGVVARELKAMRSMDAHFFVPDPLAAEIL